MKKNFFFYSKDHTCRLLIPKIIFKINTFWNKRTTPKENVRQKNVIFFNGLLKSLQIEGMEVTK